MSEFSYEFQRSKFKSRYIPYKFYTTFYPLGYEALLYVEIGYLIGHCRSSRVKSILLFNSQRTGLGAIGAIGTGHELYQSARDRNQG